MAADLQDRGLDDSGVRLHSDKKSKRKKSTMQDVDEVVTGDPEGSSRDAESRLGKEEKEKKKKKRKRDVENIDQVGDGSREGKERKKERKKRKKDGILSTAVDVDPVTTPPTNPRTLSKFKMSVIQTKVRKKRRRRNTKSTRQKSM